VPANEPPETITWNLPTGSRVPVGSCDQTEVVAASRPRSPCSSSRFSVIPAALKQPKP